METKWVSTEWWGNEDHEQYLNICQLFDSISVMLTFTLMEAQVNPDVHRRVSLVSGFG